MTPRVQKKYKGGTVEGCASPMASGFLRRIKLL